MCIAIALTAARLGATTLNHTTVTDIHKRLDENGKEVVSGARMRDMFTGEWDHV